MLKLNSKSIVKSLAIAAVLATSFAVTVVNADNSDVNNQPHKKAHVVKKKKPPLKKAAPKQGPKKALSAPCPSCWNG